MSTYGQFCPVALASELLTRRWTPLVVREMLGGSTRFNDLRRGVPKMSPSLLSKRLDELEQAGVIERRSADEHDHDEYVLTRAGRELEPVIEAMGIWGTRWITAELPAGDLDVDLLMWDVRRRIDTNRAPDGRTVVRFHYEDQPEDHRDYWLVVDEGEVDLCWRDPGFDVDLTVETTLRMMTRVWRGDVRFGEALRHHRLQLRGPAPLRRSFPEWLGYSVFAGVERPA
ncbi:MAG: helix-turn-helix domain-containing protein [Gemmatimonadales bacterium]|jgi:DNA-binding HxlR family transcriptional regulator